MGLQFQVFATKSTPGRRARRSTDKRWHWLLQSLAAMDWESLQTFVIQGNSQQFLKQVAESLQTGNKQFGILQKGLRTHCFQQVDISLDKKRI